MASIGVIKDRLVASIQKCNFRGLHQSATWACEQLQGMENETEPQDSMEDDTYSEFSMSLEICSPHERNQLLFASSLLNSGEYLRAAFVLKKKRSDKKAVSSHAGLFLLYYSQYMAGEKAKDQLYAESSKIPAAAAKPGEEPPADEKVANPNNQLRLLKNNYLVEIYRGLLPLYLEDKCDSFLIYLLAVVVRDLYRTEGVPVDLVRETFAEWKHTDTPEKQRRSGKDPRLPLQPRSLFLHSLAMNPWNWSCWLELAALCVTDSLPLPEWSEVVGCKVSLGLLDDHPEERMAYLCFLAHAYLEKHRGDLAMQAIELALPVFPTSLALHCQVGQAHYSSRDYERAEEAFELVRQHDPYRIAGMDTYSNILYVTEKRAELSMLAHSVVKIEKYAPESCCIVGNYYSLKGQHERAICYFQRALALNSQYLSAWTLIGHEYMELRNTATAVSCYRQALNISEADYRAWYGLGQTYEMLHLYQYASYYYKKAATLKPTDARMWSALGNCMLKLNFREEAIAVFERAVGCGDTEGISTRELARLCRSEGQSKRAADFYYRYLQTTSVLHTHSSHAAPTIGSDGNPVADLEGVQVTHFAEANPSIDADQAEALLFLANYYRRARNFDLAELFCSRLLNSVGSEGDEARAMSKDMRYQTHPVNESPLRQQREGVGSRPTTANRSPRGSGLDGSVSFADHMLTSGGAGQSEVMEEEESGEVQYYPDHSQYSQGGGGGLDHSGEEEEGHFQNYSHLSDESSLPPLNMTQALSYQEDSFRGDSSSLDMSRVAGHLGDDSGSQSGLMSVDSPVPHSFGGRQSRK